MGNWLNIDTEGSIDESHKYYLSEKLNGSSISDIVVISSLRWSEDIKIIKFSEFFFTSYTWISNIYNRRRWCLLLSFKRSSGRFKNRNNRVVKNKLGFHCLCIS